MSDRLEEIRKRWEKHRFCLTEDITYLLAQLAERDALLERLEKSYNDFDIEDDLVVAVENINDDDDYRKLKKITLPLTKE